MKKISISLIFISFCFIAFKIMDFIYPVPNPIKLKKFSQLVVDKNGLPLRAFADSNGVWRYPTDYKSVSPEYLEALINYEDRWFWHHWGVNPFSMVRAVKQFVVNGKVVSGGSTLTMQVARIFDPHKKSIPGKLWQMFRAFQLEYHFSKAEILNLYLNYAPFGGPIEGIEAATYTYLGKSAADLTSAEAALMAVLPQSPSRFRPDRHPQRAQKARDKVIRRMRDFAVWSKAQAEEALEEMVVAEFNSRPVYAPLLARYLKSIYRNKSLIKTTIDLDVQLSLQSSLKDYLYRFSENTSASAMVMKNKSLEVVAYVGAADFANTRRFGHLDMNRAIRSPGSTLKPFIYGMAMDEGLVHSESLLQDVPLNFGQYNPRNFTDNFAGPVSLSTALQRSLNVPAVQVLSHLGAEKFAAKIENAGLKLYIPGQGKPSLSLALGGVGVKLYELISVYRALAVDGIAGKPRYLPESPREERYLLSPEAAWVMGEILAAVPIEARQKSPFLKKEKQWVAFKTGTSYGHRDAWVVAVTPEYTIAVWVGKPDGTPSPGEFGRRTAVPMVRNILQLLPHEKRTGKRKPQQVTLENICWPLGKLAAITSKQHCHQTRQAWLINRVSPVTPRQQQWVEQNPLEIEVEIDSGKRVFSTCRKTATRVEEVALWPVRLEPWLNKRFKRKTLLPELSEGCNRRSQMTQDLIIAGVKDKSQIKRPPGSSLELELSLSVIGSQSDLSWLVNGQWYKKTQAGESLLLKALDAGEYLVMVFNHQGQSATIRFRVL